MDIYSEINDVLLDLDFLEPPRGYRNQKIEYKIFDNKVKIYGSRGLYFLKRDVNEIIERIKYILSDNGYNVTVQTIDRDDHYMRYSDEEDANWYIIAKGIDINFYKEENESLKYLTLFESFKSKLN